MSEQAKNNIAVYSSLSEVPAGFGPSVAAIGNFDGVHVGHREILSAVIAEARSLDAKAVAITFDPHPERFLRPEKAPGLLTPPDERLRLLAETGIDAVLVLKFDAVFAGLHAREFVERVLAGGLGVRGLHEGGNFRFGVRAEAGVEELRAFGAEFGFALHVHEAVHVHGLEVSSSAVREALAAGDMRRARWMLGRPFAVRARQKRDRGVGSKLVVPTVNLADYEGLLPAFGVYVTRIAIDGRWFDAVTNVGNRPTFAGAGFSVETHILNFEPVELTEETQIELAFLFRLRGEQTFPSAEALKAQILRDVARARRYFRLAGQ
ncbi:MAG: bifunctional riboflavin kinase/FAD synthetase [Terracidiphilus sp.]|nr:bifunctional riboflavin kinase/FAD synthetase [Terracidiphilus sp.]